MHYVDYRAAQARQLRFLAEAEQAHRQIHQNRDQRRQQLRDLVAHLLLELAASLKTTDDSVAQADARRNALSSN